MRKPDREQKAEINDLKKKIKKAIDLIQDDDATQICLTNELEGICNGNLEPEDKIEQLDSLLDKAEEFRYPPDVGQSWDEYVETNDHEDPRED